jgi:myo-inositol-1(or 4)-monophosphatase
VDIAKAIDGALASVLEAGGIARRHFRTDLDADNKLGDAGYDPVTIADREIEIFLRAELARRTPGLRIVGEEFGTTGDGADYWIIDPIDGTRAFISGMPSWGILLGLVVGGHAVAGIMHQPFTGETFIADEQRGSRLLHAGRERKLASSRRTGLADAVLYSTDPSIIEQGGLTDAFIRLAKSCRLQRWGGDCYSLALIAAGSIDLVVEGALQPYDIVPMIAIIEQAGGIVTDLQGNSPLSGGSIVAAGNRELHSRALSMLARP